MSSRLRSVLFWSILAAAFIGPGTVTTASKAGSNFGLGLLWALLFSIIATLVLQEAAARLTLGTGLPLGKIIGRDAKGQTLGWILFVAIALGCGAYQAGNLLGALAGLQLLGDYSKWWLLLLGGVATLLLWSGNTKIITRSLAFIVALMGIVFCWVALGTKTTTSDWMNGLTPVIDDSSALLVIGLIGTTIVPYNLFLASGLSKGQNLKEMRFGLLAAILIGGVITLAIIVSGTNVVGEFSFANLGTALDDRLAGKGKLLLGVGLFSAGLSSAITAPLAAAIAGQSLVGYQQKKWANNGLYFRLSWGVVLLAGLFFGLTDIQPIPAIIVAQAINGVILPLAAVALLLAVNNHNIMPEGFRNPAWLNILGIIIVAITVFLGLHNIWLAVGKVFPAVAEVTQEIRFTINIIGAIILALVLGWKILQTS
ncbi:MAG: Nramp family divalent metal transporter [Bacteroidota bacterium]